MSRKKPGAVPPVPTAAFHSPFAGLKSLRQALPAGAPPRPAPLRAGPARAVVRLEKKGRRGKEVTVVEQLALSQKERQAWLQELRRTLGCGGAEEEGALVLQGDHRQRVEAYLRARGVLRISVG
ncbi:MAG: translation initiation factor [Myxococcaceae bacterium]